MYTAEDIINEKSHDIIATSPDSTVADALKIMLEKKIGAIAIKENENYIGIWTERDLMRNVVTEGFFSKTSKIKDFMSTDLKTAQHNQSVFALQDKMLGERIRHLFIQKEGQIIGILSTGDVIKTILNDKNKELHELNAIVNFDYYENWKFVKKHK
jgi:signal-transduction protein with cAMP-binding, CBS, and nucleotidyltransferase domain